MQTTLQPAFILHRRSYRETSLLVELFTQEQGRIAVVARGIRKARSRTAVLLQPFMPILVSWFGQGELLTLSQVEATVPVASLSGKNLRCGFYLNELLLRLLPKFDAHPQLFSIYQQTLQELNSSNTEIVLRRFEKNLLEEIGYGLSSKADNKFLSDNYYRFDLIHGFLPFSEGPNSPGVFSGTTLNALLDENFADAQILREIKALMRFIFSALLGGKPIESRQLFEFQKEADNYA